MSDREQAPEPERRAPPDQLVDAMASAVLQANDDELSEAAAAAGEDLADAAASLRERFLDRVAAARAHAPSPSDLDTPSDGDLDQSDPEQVGKIGRYPLLRRLGSGGMGVVYAAYDEVLDRRIAIKVLHSHTWDIEGRRRERLLREAQAMARVTHPNVITVHEVGTAGDQLFVAMEFVAGPTLQDWLEQRERPWREIVAVFREVAEGLGAIHEAGLVHRDVKPSNVLIGDDGRVRVLDLGLVGADPHEFVQTEGAQLSLESSSSHNRLNKSLTRTGERLGTPAYMSREQFMGLELTPASDIFSLCVALYEALHGIHPFMADTFYELQSNVIAAKVKPPPSPGKIPTWLHALIVSGLAADPEDRPASMQALAAALAKDPSRARRRWIVTVGAASLAALLGVVVTRAQTSTPAPASCDGGSAAIATVWSRAWADEIRAAMLATDRPYAGPLAERVRASLDEYAGDWSAAHDRACREHARGEYSAALLDARMACLDRRRAALAETVEILADANAEVVENAGQMVARLPRLEPCDDLAALANRRPPPTDPNVAAAVAELDERLVRASALANAGRVDEAVTIARDVAREAEALEQPATVAAALLGEARAAIVMQRDPNAVGELLTRALALAIAQNLDALAAEAMMRRLYVRGLASGGSEAALGDVPIAEAMLARADEEPELRALLLNNTGAIHMAAGEREAAREAFERSLVIKERLYGERHLELALGLANLGMLSSSAERRAEVHGRMLDIYERELGPDHPRTLDARLLAAFYTADPARAAAAYAELCPRFIEIGEPRLAGECELERGRVEFVRGNVELARRAFVAAREQIDEGQARRALLDAYLDLDAPELDRAIARLRDEIDEIDEIDAAQDRGDWWVRLEQAERRLLLARMLATAGTPEAGSDELERAIADLQVIAEQAQPIERERLLAAARAALARSRAAAGADPAAVATLADAARSYYQTWPEAYARPLAELDELGAPTDQDNN